MLRAWTVQRAAMAGVAAGLGALLLAASPGAWPDWLLYAYAGLLALTCLCGLSILWITIMDMRARGRGGRMRRSARSTSPSASPCCCPPATRST